MKRINFAISMGSNVTSIYKAGVGVVLSDKSAIVTTLKGKYEVAYAVGDEAISSGLDYKKIFNKNHHLNICYKMKSITHNN